jgi:hypothetical protein
LIAVGTILGLLLLCCIVGWFFGIPRLRDTVSDELSDELSTQVAIQLDERGVDVDAGTYTLRVADLQQQINANLDSQTADDFRISVDRNGMDVKFTSGNQEIGYSGVPVAQDGKLVMDDMTVDNDVLGWFMPADRLGDTIEDGINNYFAAQNLQIESIVLGEDTITFTTVPA